MSCSYYLNSFSVLHDLKLILSTTVVYNNTETRSLNMSANQQLPARPAKIIRRRPGQVFARPRPPPASETLARDKVNSAVDELVSQLSRTNIGDGTEVQILSTDYDSIVDELSSRLASTNFQVVAEDDEGYASGKTSPPWSKRRADDLGGLTAAQRRDYRDACANIAYGQQHKGNVIALDPMALPQYFWDTLEIKDRLKIQAMGGSSNSSVQQMKVMLLRAQQIISNGQGDDWLVKDDLEMRLDELF